MDYSAREPRLDDENEEKKASEPNAFLEEALFKARTILLTGGIDFLQARRVCERLLALSSENDKPILLVLSSPGGHVESGDTIHDLISFIASPVAMIGTGWVASIATHIFLSVPAERRFCLPNTRFLIHQPSGGARGPASDIAIQAQEIVKMRERIAKKIADATGQSHEKVLKDIDRDFWMSTDEAKEYGILGKVIDSAKDVTWG